MGKVIDWASGEWILNKRANGGSAVLFRALWVSGLVYFATLVFLWLESGVSICHVTWKMVRDAAAANFKVAGAAFAAAYTAFYARFASQWSYLAGVYNQIMAAKVRGVGGDDSAAKAAILAWQAGFIEDAEELHLATKPMFAGVIMSMLAEEGVREKYIEGTAGGSARLAALEIRVKRAYEDAAQRFKNNCPRPKTTGDGE